MNRNGTTLTELLLVLTIMTIFATMAVPQARHALDVLNVRSARETIFGMAAQTRSLALARGGTLVIDAAAKTVSSRDADGAMLAQSSLEPYAVTVDAGAINTVAMNYDARGLGRMTSRTIRLARGRAEAGLTFSAYGRVRRW